MFQLNEKFLVEDSFISTEKYFQFALTIPGITYTKREALYSFETWRGYHLGPLALNLKKIFDRVLIVGHSDKDLDIARSMPLRVLGARKVFGVNTYPLGNFARPIPLGVTNATNESERHIIYGNNDHFRLAWEGACEKGGFQGRIYANFSTWTYKKERSPLLTFLKNLDHVSYDEFNLTNKGRVDFLKKLRMNDFVVCPRGNGIDTHRAWETLYMGGIPIVRREPIMQSVLQGLPVLFVDKWKEIEDLNFLEAKWHEINSGSYQLERLNIEYWRNLIRSYVNPQRLSW